MPRYKALETGFVGGRRVRRGETFTSRATDIPWAEPVEEKHEEAPKPAPRPRAKKAADPLV